MRRLVLAAALFACANANAVIPEGSFERCTNSNASLAEAVSFSVKANGLYVIVETGITTGSIVAYRVATAAGAASCHPAGAGWIQTTTPAYTSGRVGTFTAYEVGGLQEVVGAGAWGASKAIQMMGWFLAPLLFGSGFLVGVRT